MTANLNEQKIQQAPSPTAESKILVAGLSVFYGDDQALFDISATFPEGKVIALIGPSGCGKSTFLRSLNRMNDTHEPCRVEGEVLVDGENIYAKQVDPVRIRRKIGMVFQQATPFPMTIFENIAFGLRIAGEKDEQEIERQVSRALKLAGLWEEVESRLGSSALNLSAGQKQRLCIARALALRPEILLMDEPASALDPRATARIEELIRDLRGRLTIIIVTHSLQQAARVSDLTAFFHLGKLVEFDETGVIFTRPKQKRTEEYISGRFG